jgi:hypothetical protein
MFGGYSCNFLCIVWSLPLPLSQTRMLSFFLFRFCI